MHFLCWAKIVRMSKISDVWTTRTSLVQSMTNRVEEARLESYAFLCILVSHGNGIRRRRIKGATAQMKGDPRL